MIAAGLIGISGLSLLIWLVLAFFRGGFWRADQRLDPAVDLDLEHWPSVVAVIPARNEAETIGVTVTSLLRQTYRGQIRVIVVDDNSDDATAKAAGTDKDLHVIHGAALAEGWTGKLWAVNQGVQAIDEIAPDADYVLLTDADIAHDPDNLRQLVCKAITDNCHLVSLMVALRCVGFWEKLLIPAFVFFFQKLYPFPLVNNPAHPMAAAAGGCMLVRLQTLRQTGGIAPIRDRLIDDCALAAQIKRQGPIWLGLSTQTRSLRAYGKLSEIWLMVARTAFVQLDHSLCNLLGTIVAMVLIYLLPPVLLVYGLAVHNPLLWLTAGGSCLLMGGLVPANPDGLSDVVIPRPDPAACRVNVCTDDPVIGSSPLARPGWGLERQKLRQKVEPVAAMSENDRGLQFFENVRDDVMLLVVYGYRP